MNGREKGWLRIHELREQCGDELKVEKFYKKRKDGREQKGEEELPIHYTSGSY